MTRRPRGRPQSRSDEETRRLVIEAAAAEFQAFGYAGTSICAVAQRAGISTRTLYRVVAAKDELFGLVISDRIGLFVLATDDEALAGLGVAEALEHVLISYAKLTLSAETIALTRLVLAECDRFPELAASFYQRAMLRTSAVLAAWLQVQCDRGLLALDDVQEASTMLRGMMVMEPQRAAMLGQSAAPGMDEIVARARVCARLFLEGCRMTGGIRKGSLSADDADGFG